MIMDVTDEWQVREDLSQISMRSDAVKSHWDQCIQALRDVQPYLMEELDILRSYPNELKLLAPFVVIEIQKYYDYLTKIRGGHDLKELLNVSTNADNIIAWKNRFFRNTKGELSSATIIYQLLINFGKSEKLQLKFIEASDEIKKELSQTLQNAEKKAQSSEQTIQDSVKNSQEIENRVKEQGSSIKTMYEEFKKTASLDSTSNYAKIFKDESDKYQNASRWWILSGIFIFILFLASVFVFNVFDKLPTENIIDGSAVYQISNIILKVTIIALIVFFVSFSVRQFSINSHLSAINKHRHNAFNSYKLFVETISPDDSTNRHNLMLQLAKAIYEQTNTGYISDKGNNVNGSIIEITRMIQGMNKE
jgi:hypothetical protein